MTSIVVHSPIHVQNCFNELPLPEYVPPSNNIAIVVSIYTSFSPTCYRRRHQLIG